MFRILVLLAAAAIAQTAIAQNAITQTASAQAWQRHTIDDSSRGADGVRLGDLNGDGLPDIATAWEENRRRVGRGKSPRACCRRGACFA